ncbi:MAG TPA: holo-ACP synthase [Thermodesulfovibrionales bacterium]|nr:holo-ACP synthase [Thermodesulfovibrionales bacterium]
MEQKLRFIFMIYGIGIDIVKIERMKKVVEKWGRRFLDRVFTKEEISYCYEKKEPYLSLSVRFAAKEALIKAIGPVSPVSLTDIEIVNVEMGKPILRVKGKLESILKEKLIKKAHLSLSHEYEYGVACVVLEQ